MSALSLAPIPPGELRRAVNAWARRGLRARWLLRLVCLARPVTLAELFEAARAEGDEQTARELATALGWLDAPSPAPLRERPG